MSKRTLWFLKSALVTGVTAAVATVHGQTLFRQDFNDPVSAASLFTVNGSVSYTDGVMTLSPGGTAVLAGNTQIADTGQDPVTYSVLQSFAPGSIVFPQFAFAEFRVRGASGSQNDGYYILTTLTSLDASIAINRITDAERQLGILWTSLRGGSMYAPPALRTLGPYELSVSLINTPGAVTISVSVNGVAALVAQDTSSHRITHGDSVGLICGGTHAASWDNLNVTIVPEPSTWAFFLMGCLVCMASVHARK